LYLITRANVAYSRKSSEKRYFNDVTATFENQGDFTEAFDIKGRANATDIET